MSDTTPGTALKITLIYLVFSVLWILWSDRAVLAFAVDTDTQALLQTFKGWFFVAVTSVGLYVLLSRSYRRTGDDVEALKRHQEALARSEQRYRSVVENMPGLLCRFTSDGVIEYANGAYAQAFGTTPDALPGKSFLDLVPEAERDEVMAPIRALTKDTPSMTQEHRVLGSGGRVGWQRWTNRRLSDGHGNTVAYQAFGLDITEQKEAEAERDELAARNQALVAALGEIVYDWYPDDDRVEWDGDFQRILGYTPEQMGRDAASWTERVHPDDHDAVWQEVADANRERRTYRIEYRFRDSAGHYRWMGDQGVLFRNAEGRLVRMLGVIRDVSPRHAAEAALRESEERYRLAQRLSGLGLWEWRIASDEVYWSDEVLAMWGFRPGEFDGEFKTVAARVHPDDLACWQENVRACVEDGCEHQIEFRIVLPDGEHRWIAAFGDAERDASGAATRMIGVTMDVTERRRAQMHEHKLLAELTRAQSVANIGSWSYEVAGGQVAWSAQMFRIFGRAPADRAPGYDRLVSWIHPDDRARHNAYLQQMLAMTPGEAIEDLQYRLVTPEGDLRWVEVTFECEFDDAGRPTRFFGTLQDITHRMQADAELRDSEAMYRALFENTPVGILIADVQSRYLDANSSMCAMLGYPREELIGMHASDIVQPSEVEHVDPALEQIKSGEDYSRVWSFRRRDGSRFEADVSASTLPDGNLIGIVRDITEQLRAERALRDSENRYRAVFDQQFQFAALLDTAGTVQQINDLQIRIQGYTREQYMGKPFWDAPPWRDWPEWRDVWQSRIAEALRTDEPILSHDQYGCADGSTRYADAATKAIRNADGEVEFVLVQASDTTDRRQAEIERDRLFDELRAVNQGLDQTVRERTAELVAANRELQSFSYAVSHDLRAPIRAISGFEQALREDFGKQLPERAHDYLAEIRTGAERMSALIDGLLEMSRSARGTLVEEPVDLAEISRELLRQFRHDQPGRDVRVQLAGDLVVEGDSRLLRNLMQILLENAWKYTSLEASAQIEIRRVQTAGLDCVCIRDNGAGFSPEFAHKLFEPFQRLHRQDEFPGIGIGLATAARIVHRHGGEIVGCGRPGERAEFCFTLG